MFLDSCSVTGNTNLIGTPYFSLAFKTTFTNLVYSNNMITELANVFTTWKTPPAHIVLAYPITFSSEVDYNYFIIKILQKRQYHKNNYLQIAHLAKTREF